MPASRLRVCSFKVSLGNKKKTFHILLKIKCAFSKGCFSDFGTFLFRNTHTVVPFYLEIKRHP